MADTTLLLDLAIGGTSIYFTNANSGAVSRVARSGGPASMLFTPPANQSIYATGIAVDDQLVYWASCKAGTFAILGSPLGGGAAKTLASGQDRVFDVSVDATHVYWTTHDSVLRIRK